MKKIGVGMAGYGSIGRIHMLAYRDIPQIYPGVLPELEFRGICRTSLENARQTAAEQGFLEAYTDFDGMLRDPDIDFIDIVTPNYLHKDQIIRALEAGKHVLCEKPLALNGREAAEIEIVSQRTGRQVGMIFNYRFIPAIMKAKSLIESGRLGELYTFRAEYYHTGYQNADRPFSWRMDVKRSGGGALVDLGVHAADLIRYLLGDIASVRCKTKTYVAERPLPDRSGKKEAVTVDDAAWVHIALKQGGEGSLEVSRFATGTLDDLNISAFGSRGSFRFNLMNPDFLYWFDQSSGEGWMRLETVQHYDGAKIPNPRSVTGWTRYHTENQYRFLKSLADPALIFQPDVHEGARAQDFLDACYRSTRTGNTEKVDTYSVS